jgi:hypothetical protein
VGRVYQWLIEQASFFRHDAVEHGTSRTVRTETTVRREGVTVLVGSVDICPLCGSKLAPYQGSALRTQTIAARSEVGSIDQLTIGAKATEK